MAHDKAPHVVIVGGGFGGLEAAKALRKSAVRITLIDRNNHHLFQPLLYQVATAGLSPADIATPIRSILSKQQNVEVLMAEVTGIDTSNQRVLMGDDVLDYDYLILATGAQDSYFGHDEWAPYARGLKTVQAATSIRRDILLSFEAAERDAELWRHTDVRQLDRDLEEQRSQLTFILVGAGPTGVEMAGAIAELARVALASDFHYINPKSARILLVEAGDRILKSFPDDLAARAQRKLEEMGVEIRVGQPVQAVDADGVVIAGERIAAKTVIWTAGVKATPAAIWLNAEADRAGRVKVMPDLSAPGHPNIYVVGDAMTVSQGGAPLPGVAPVAMQQGRYVAAHIRSILGGRRSTAPFEYTDKGNLATVGRSFAILDAHGLHMSGFPAWIAWLGIHIIYLIGFRNRILVLIQWAYAYLTFQRGARLIVQDSHADEAAKPAAATEESAGGVRRSA